MRIFLCGKVGSQKTRLRNIKFKVLCGVEKEEEYRSVTNNDGPESSKVADLESSNCCQVKWILVLLILIRM
jgi:hypothetical protein